MLKCSKKKKKVLKILEKLRDYLCRKIKKRNSAEGNY